MMLITVSKFEEFTVGKKYVLSHRIVHVTNVTSTVVDLIDAQGNRFLYSRKTGKVFATPGLARLDWQLYECDDFAEEQLYREEVYRVQVARLNDLARRLSGPFEGNEYAVETAIGILETTLQYLQTTGITGIKE
jgi:hypothetical protein